MTGFWLPVGARTQVRMCLCCSPILGLVVNYVRKTTVMKLARRTTKGRRHRAEFKTKVVLPLAEAGVMVNPKCVRRVLRASGDGLGSGVSEAPVEPAGRGGEPLSLSAARPGDRLLPSREGRFLGAQRAEFLRPGQGIP